MSFVLGVKPIDVLKKVLAIQPGTFKCERECVFAFGNSIGSSFYGNARGVSVCTCFRWYKGGSML